MQGFRIESAGYAPSVEQDGQDPLIGRGERTHTRPAVSGVGAGAVVGAVVGAALGEFLGAAFLDDGTMWAAIAAGTAPGGILGAFWGGIPPAGIAGNRVMRPSPGTRRHGDR